MNLLNQLESVKVKDSFFVENVIVTFGVDANKFPDEMIKKIYGNFPLIRCKSERYANSEASNGESLVARIYGFDPTDPTRNILVQWNITGALKQFAADNKMSPEDTTKLLSYFPGYGEAGNRWVYGSIARDRFSKNAIEKFTAFDTVNQQLNQIRAHDAYRHLFVTSKGKAASTERFYNKSVSYNTEGFNQKVLSQIPATDGKSVNLYQQVGSLYNIPGVESLDGLLLVIERKVNARTNREYYTVTTFDTVANKPFTSYKGDIGAQSQNGLVLADQSADKSADFTEPTKLVTEHVDLATFVAKVTQAGVDLAVAQKEGVELDGVKYILKV